MSESPTATEITDADLLEKAEQARLRAGISPAEGVEGSGPTVDEEEAKPVTVDCDKCSTPFTYLPIKMGGREVAKRFRCPGCVEQDKQKLLEVREKQDGYQDSLARLDADTQLRALLETMGANPWEHGHCTLENFDTTEAGPRPRVLAQDFADAVRAAGPYDPVRGLYLHGETGPGKTHLAIGVVRYLVEAGLAPAKMLYDHATELILRIQDTYGRKDSYTFDVLEKRFAAHLWILDDFGTERCSDDVVRHMTTIFTRRAMRPSLITSNFSPERLDKERPELMRVLSRLGPRYFRVCEVKGRDRRFD